MNKNKTQFPFFEVKNAITGIFWTLVIGIILNTITRTIFHNREINLRTREAELEILQTTINDALNSSDFNPILTLYKIKFLMDLGVFKTINTDEFTEGKLKIKMENKINEKVNSIIAINDLMKEIDDEVPEKIVPPEKIKNYRLELEKHKPILLQSNRIYELEILLISLEKQEKVTYGDLTVKIGGIIRYDYQEGEALAWQDNNII